MKAYIYTRCDNKQYAQIENVEKAISFTGHIALITKNGEKHIFPIWKFTVRIYQS